MIKVSNRGSDDRSCEYFTLYSKRDFADMSVVRDFKMTVFSWIIWVLSNLITDPLKQRITTERCDETGTQFAIDSLKMEERSQEARNVCGLKARHSHH